ncbi:glycogen debranching protein GlgX [Paenarthrobacter sp. DKR-5]|uniref:glycogen debranching protein GlgX n=1 Tax=Paenarthrobacter sp. DKR-5 TaxID=2835535 RepID=UPI001BDBD0BC|nr:glycogen debranching protein GlgX [Paenarthrobacter sp. DKR-5]MBT1003629.1 glycogen debranching protein GlgX [Paenarthrobacter sp. DKR-5]
MTETLEPGDGEVPSAEHSFAYPLGVSPAGHRHVPAFRLPDAANVAVYAPDHAALKVVFQAPGEPWREMVLPGYSDGVHHGLVPIMPAGTRYGFLPAGAEVTNPDAEGVQLLLDPYGRAIDERAGQLTSVRVGRDFDWGNDRAPRTPWRNTVVYEAHVKGMTKLHPDIPAELRGTYAGMAHPAMIEYLVSLGVTAVQLLPVHYHLDEPHLKGLGLTNYWGYNSIGFFAPHPSYATERARAAGPHAVQDEFKGMIKLLHQAGLEVILDVVYNHTAEAGRDLPTLSWRGLAEQRYYRVDGHGRYIDTTGCGNSLNFSEPRVVQLVLDSLRYWVEEFHVDGFRFDLAVTLCRNAANEFDPHHPFLVAVGADPALSGTKLIAEPWDVGYGGWQTGRFPVGWVDWNDHFRDNVRTFWVSDRGSLEGGGLGSSVARLADGLSGSAALFAASGRGQLASLNMITAHDGFTLADLVSYDRKHNEDNGEENRDGHNDNHSYNHGVEGPTQVEEILAARAQTSRNMMATLMLSLGVPMLTAGDELGRTQHGNNNAYCQDNQISWMDWTLDKRAHDMLRSTKRLIRVRREFLAAQPYSYPARKDSSYLFWFDEHGEAMGMDRWNDPGNRVVQLVLGSQDGHLDGLVVVNGSGADLQVTLPVFTNDAGTSPAKFELRLTTSPLHERRQGVRVAAGERDLVEAFSINVYRA